MGLLSDMAASQTAIHTATQSEHNQPHPPGRTAEASASAPSPIVGRCLDCFLRPDLWQARPSKRYRDREVVVCRVCGRWIGYRLSNRKPTANA